MTPTQPRSYQDLGEGSPTYDDLIDDLTKDPMNVKTPPGWEAFSERMNAAREARQKGTRTGATGQGSPLSRQVLSGQLPTRSSGRTLGLTTPTGQRS